MSHDFSPLGSEADLPGEPAEIRALAQRYTDTADEIVAAANRLQRIAGHTEGAWIGRSGQVFPGKANDLAGRIRKAESRYRRTGDALASFAGRADGAQHAAASAAHRARAAQADLDASAPVAAPSGSDPTPEEKAAADQRADQHDRASRNLRAAHDDFADAKRDYDDAARRAHEAISSASHDDLHDSWWYRHWHSIVGFLVVVAIIVAVIAVVCLVIACPFVAGLIGAMAGWSAAGVGTFMAVAGGIATAADIVGGVLAVTILALDVDGKVEGHDVSRRTLVFDALGAASFGLGRGLSSALGRTVSGGEEVAAGARGTDAAFEVLDDFQTALDRAPTMLDYAMVDALRPVAVEQALARMAEAEAEVKAALDVAARANDMPMLRLMLRDRPTELLKLGRLAEDDPQLAAMLEQYGRLARIHGAVQNTADAGLIGGYLKDQADDRAFEHHLDAIVEQTHRHVMHVK